MYIPVAVLREIAKTDLITDLLNKEWIKVKKVSDEELKEMEKDKEFANLGSGEKSVWLCVSVLKNRHCS